MSDRLAVERARRKHDLLLASELARGEAALALAELDARAQMLMRGAAWLRACAATPRLRWSAGTLTAGLLVLLAAGRTHGLPLLRWSLLAARVWRAWRR